MKDSFKRRSSEHWKISYHLIEPWGHAGSGIWHFAIKALKLFAVTLTLLSNSYRWKSIWFLIILLTIILNGQSLSEAYPGEQ